jgi:hypothetical protein
MLEFLNLTRKIACWDFKKMGGDGKREPQKKLKKITQNVFVDTPHKKW